MLLENTNVKDMHTMLVLLTDLDSFMKTSQQDDISKTHHCGNTRDTSPLKKPTA